MSKPLLQLAALGVLGFSLWKLGSFFFIPLLFLALKIALVVGVVLFAVRLFKRNDRNGASDSETGTSQPSGAPRSAHPQPHEPRETDRDDRVPHPLLAH